MNTKTVLVFLLICFFVIGLVRLGMRLGSSESAGTTIDGVAAIISDGVQRTTISFSRSTYNYEPSVIHLKKNIPAEITVDLDSVAGCLTTIQIPAFGVQFAAQRGNNIIKFTPDKTGTFAFHCPMRMGRGTIIVE